MDKVDKQPNLIDASPTKELFISMLIKDITLNDAIGDLIDNCVDGALELRPNKDYSGLRVNITATSDLFIIKDNCGGISYENAKNYAFRFGRTLRTPTKKGSVGQFGIGMKRALFKMGRLFDISSVSKRSKFKVKVNVDEWEKQPKTWSFMFEDLHKLESKDKNLLESERETEIRITNLNDEVKKRFGNPSFIPELKEEIELEHIINIARGLEIRINKVLLEPLQLQLINSDQFKPGYWEYDFLNGLMVRAIVGVSEKKLRDGGWYLFCNDRKILGPEQTNISGWGARKPTSIPKYHGQYERFRGYVFFESDDTSLLPWNTSKNNMDVDSPTYRYVKQNMIILMRPVMDFLNKLHSEGKKADEEAKLLELSLNSSLANLTSVFKIIDQASNLSSRFVFPSLHAVSKSELRTRISYYREKTKVNKVMAVMGIKDPKTAGEKTFDYFFENECEE